MLFAAAVARHPAVRSVDYPGLPGHPGHETAIRLFDAGPEGTRFGAIVTVTPHGGRQAGYDTRGPAACRPGGHLAGGHAHQGQPRGLHDAPAVRRRRPRRRRDGSGAVRFSVGLEDGEDLIADVRQALDALGTAPGSTGFGSTEFSSTGFGSTGLGNREERA